MQALPLYLDKLFHPVVAVILSVTFVLAFGEVHLVITLCDIVSLKTELKLFFPGVMKIDYSPSSVL